MQILANAKLAKILHLENSMATDNILNKLKILNYGLAKEMWLFLLITREAISLFHYAFGLGHFSVKSCWKVDWTENKPIKTHAYYCK